MTTFTGPRHLGRGGAGALRPAIAAALTAALLATTPAVSAAEAGDPTQQADDAVACPEPSPATGFTDAAGTHATGIGCAAAYGITGGVSPTTFAPNRPLDRGQSATMLVRLLRATGAPAHPPETRRFSDVAGTTHADNIEALAALGVVSGTTATTFAPSAPVRRDQMASFLDRTLTHLALPPEDREAPFEDVDATNVHADAIGRLTAAGIISGTSATTFDPSGTVTRGQMASLVARTADRAAAAGLVHAPYGPRPAELAPGTVVLDAEERDALAAADADGTLHFEALPPRIEVGAVLASVPTDAAPAGLLRRVTTVDGDTVATVPAAITEAVRSGHGAASRPLDLAGATSVTAGEGVTVASSSPGAIRIDLGDGVPAGDGAVAAGEVVVALTAQLSATVALRDDEPYVAGLSTTTSGRVESDLRLSATRAASLDADVPLLTATFAPITADVGGLPLTAVPTLEIAVTAEGSVATTTRFAAAQQTAADVGVRYVPATGWAPVAEALSQATAGDRDLSAAADASVAAPVHAALRLYGDDLAGATLTPGVRGVADPTDDPAWTVTGRATVATTAPATNLLPGVPAATSSYTATARLATAPPPPPPPPVQLGPGWVAAPGSSATFGTGGTLFTYTVEIRDGLASRQDLSEFQEFVDATLGEASKGWTSRGTIRMRRIDEPADARIRVLLASPATVDRLCGAVGLDTGGRYSCWTGRYAALNSDRWFQGVDHVDSLSLYRRYLINHEVGHGLGYGHRSCPGPGRTAPVMMQLTKSTYGCVPNPHPYP